MLKSDKVITHSISKAMDIAYCSLLGSKSYYFHLANPQNLDMCYNMLLGETLLLLCILTPNITLKLCKDDFNNFYYILNLRAHSKLILKA